MLRSIPLLLPLVVIYFILAFLIPSTLGGVALAVTLPSGIGLVLRGGDLLLALGLLLLYVEILKSTSSAAASVLDHGLSLVLFILCLILFIVAPAAGTSTFFLILIMTLLDVVAGFTVTIAASRRDVGVEGLH
ncbi:conserved membrane hypothetical protein [Azospirillaceae bacterium]